MPMPYLTVLSATLMMYRLATIHTLQADRQMDRRTTKRTNSLIVLQ